MLKGVGVVTWRGVLTAGISAVVATAALTGCSRTAESTAAPTAPPTIASASTPAPTPPPSTTSARATADREAVAAYAGMLRIWADAAKTANPETPALREYTQGDALKFLTNLLFGMQLERKVALGAPGTSPAAIDARPVDVPTTVVIRDCLDSTRWLEYQASGELWDDKPGERHELKAVVKKTDAGWKVDAFVIRDVTC